MAQERHRQGYAEPGRGTPPHAVARPEDERSIGELFSELASETQTLINQEFQLVKTEVQETATKATRGVSFVAAGGFVAYAGLVLVLAAIGYLLALAMPLWLGFLIVGAVTLIIGYAVLQTGLNRLQETDFSFTRTADSLEEDKQWIQEEAQEVKEDPQHLGSTRR